MGQPFAIGIHMASRPKESLLRQLIRQWPEYEDGRVMFIEPGMGSDVGLPDTMMNSDLDSKLIPVELKRGRSVVSELRPSQRIWHRQQLYHGNRTYGLLLTHGSSSILYALSLSGGLLSEIQEEQICSWSSAWDMSYPSVMRAINAYCSRTL